MRSMALREFTRNCDIIRSLPGHSEGPKSRSVKLRSLLGGRLVHTKVCGTIWMGRSLLRCRSTRVRMRSVSIASPLREPPVTNEGGRRKKSRALCPCETHSVSASSSGIWLLSRRRREPRPKGSTTLMPTSLQKRTRGRPCFLVR